MKIEHTRASGARRKSFNAMGTLASRRRVPENAGGTPVFPAKPEVFTTFTARTRNACFRTEATLKLPSVNPCAGFTDDEEEEWVMTSSVEEKVKSIIVEQLGVNESEVTGDASFVDDLGADSLDTIELVMAFEEAFGIEIPDEAAEKIKTVQDAVDYVDAHKK